MLFTSHIFTLVFLPIVLSLFLLSYRFLGLRTSLSGLTIASLFFYGWWNPVYLWLIGFSIVANFITGHLLSQSEKAYHRRWILALGISINLALLGYFKYSLFFVENVNVFLDLHIAIDPVILPLAISFFTFQQISYIVDVSKNRDTHYPLSDYILYVTFFPQLIAGPIVRHNDIIPQFSHPYQGQDKSIWISRGLVLFTLGLFKKVVLANGLEDISSPYFDSLLSGESALFIDSWQASLAFTFQIYFDFSAYSDMAIGLALMFGFSIPENFNIPYAAFDIQEFWRRWHISLSNFLRDYLYIPLGGNRFGLVRQMQALITTMFLGGLWHGASWSFVVWGLLHGFALVLHVLWQKLGYRFPKPIAWIILFLFLVFTWVLFRLDDFSIATNMMQSMLAFNQLNLSTLNSDGWGFILITALIAIVGPSSTMIALDRLKPNALYAILFSFILVYLIVITGHEPREFIYFQF
jgi:D-alanyl-lipoteichoic acid acyltransferase DltB (MBOAT superfamily)